MNIITGTELAKAMKMNKCLSFIAIFFFVDLHKKK